MIRAAALFAAAASFNCLHAQSADRLLEAVAARYRSAEPIHLRGVSRLSSGELKLENFRELVRASGGRERLHFRNQRRELLFVADGDGMMACLPRQNQCTRGTRSEVKARGGHYAWGSPLAVWAALVPLVDPGYDKLDSLAAGAKITGTERVKAGGENRETVRIDIAPSLLARGGTRRLWIDPQTNLVWKEEVSQLADQASARTIVAVTTWEVVLAGGSVDSALFTLERVPRAQWVDALDMPVPPRTTVAGTAAHGFALPHAETGAVVNLAAHRGKIVLLDFWTTWCPPCRAELPVLEKLHRELQSKGVVVIGISDESAETVERFRREQNLTFPTLIDSGRKVYDAYEIYSIPTSFVIDASGRITAVLTGAQREEALRKAIAGAGGRF